MDNQEYEKKEGFIKSHDNNRFRKGKQKRARMIFLGVLLLIALIGGVFIGPKVLGEDKNKAEIITVSTLEKIVAKSELSTFQAVYNGIAEVMNEKKPEKTDYHVSYKAKVKVGFDLNKVKIDKDEESKIITIDIPKIAINDITVDMESLDYIFQNDKANVSAVSVQAYNACIEDVTNESYKETAIYELAEQNAEKIMKALISPFIDQLDAEYELIVKFGGI